MSTRWLLFAALSVPITVAAQTQPAPPTNVTATADPRGWVTIAWTGPRATVTYRVLRSTDSRSWTDLARPPLEMGTVSFADAGAAPSTTYYYQVVAVYTDGTQGASVPVQFVPLTAVAPVTTASTGTLTVQPVAVAPAVPPPGPPPWNVQLVSAGPLARTVTWGATTGVSGYNVSLATTPAAGPWQLLNPSPLVSLSLLDTGLRPAGAAYRVTALYPDGRQGSADVSYTPPPFEVPASFGAAKVWLNGVLLGTTVRLTFKEVAWAKGYRLFGTGQPAGGAPLNAQLAPTIVTLPGPRTMEGFLQNLPDGAYTWQITADYGGAWQGAGLPTAALTIFDLCAPPQPQVGPAPDNVYLKASGGSGSPTTVQLSWRKVSGAVAYTVERENYTSFGPVTTIGSSCANLQAFYGMVIQPNKTALPNVYFTDDTGGLVAGSGYRYKVTAYGAAGEKGWKTEVILVK